MSLVMTQVLTNEPEEVGKPASFRQQAEAYYAPVYRFLVRQTRTRQDAEDLTQQTFVEACKSFHRFNPDRAFAPWIYTIARRCLADFYRKPSHQLENLNEDTLDPSLDPHESASQAEQFSTVWDQASRLKPKYHQILLLHYQEHFSLQETARIMGLTVPHAKVLLFRARQALKKRLENNPIIGEQHR